MGSPFRPLPPFSVPETSAITSGIVNTKLLTDPLIYLCVSAKDSSNPPAPVHIGRLVCACL